MILSYWSKDKMCRREMDKEEVGGGVGGIFGPALLSSRLGGRAIWRRLPVLDLMDETNCGLFSLVTLKSLSLLHGHADFYGHLRQSAAVHVCRSARWGGGLERRRRRTRITL